MRRVCTAHVIAIMLAASAGPAHAANGDAYLGWYSCYHDGSVSDISFPCGAGPGQGASMYLSFVPPAPMADFIAMDFRLDTGTTLMPIPDFWQFATVVEPSNCNPGIEAHHERPLPGCASAADTWNAGSQAIVGYMHDSGSFNRGHIVGSVFRLEAETIAISTGTEYFGVEIRILADAATESGGACAGCTAPMTFTVSSITLVSLAGVDGFISPTVESACVTSNGGVSCFTVPVQNRTWGRLKQLYR